MCLLENFALVGIEKSCIQGLGFIIISPRMHIHIYNHATSEGLKLEIGENNSDTISEEGPQGVRSITLSSLHVFYLDDKDLRFS